MKTQIFMRFFSLLVFMIPLLVFPQNFSEQPTEFNSGSSFAEYNLDTANSTFVIKGTSSLHDWEMTSRAIDGAIAFIKTDATSIDVQAINVTIGVRTFESGNRIMNKKCYEALKDDEYPNIFYRFKSLESIKSTGNNTFNANLNGTLTIAGVTKTVKIAVRLVNGGNKVIITGTKALKMSDFDIEPPRALLGTLKTGNDITIEFNLNYLSQ